MHRIASVIVVFLILSGCSKGQTAASCRLEVTRKWHPDVLKTCIDAWSPLASPTNPTPKCSDVDQATAFMRLCMEASRYKLAERCSLLRFEQFEPECYNYQLIK